MGLCPLIEAANVKRPLISPKSHLFPRRHVNGTVGLPKTLIDEYPIIRGRDLCFDKTCHWPCLEVRNKAVKWFKIIIRLEHNVCRKSGPWT